MSGIFVALGSNLGERERNLARALRELEVLGVRVKDESSLYLTEPVGGPKQDWFVNQAARVETALSPEALLAAGLQVEETMGRVRGARDGPRLIDIDLLLYGTERREGPELVLPHPRLHERRFVLVPLAEIAPDAWHPILSATVRDLLARCTDTSAVRPLEGTLPPA